MSKCYELRMNSAMDSILTELEELLQRIRELDANVARMTAEGQVGTERYRSAHEIGQTACEILEEAAAGLKLFNGCFTLCENAAADVDSE